MDLRTSYMGLSLRSPLVPSASPLSNSLDNLKRMEDAGAAAVVLHSLFEEQIRYERYAVQRALARGHENYPPALKYLPEPDEIEWGSEAYLRFIQRAKQAVGIPIIASLNGASPGGWTTFAKAIQEAGADALELNIYSVPTDPNLSGADIEQECVDILKAVKAIISIPVAVKLSPFFTNFAHMARRLDEAGANGLVLFNRFYQPDIELESMGVTPTVYYSSPMALRLPLRWIAILHERVGASLAATGGIHSGTDALKLLLAGADVTMVCSVLLRHGIERLGRLQQELCAWMQEHDYNSVRELKGALSHKHCEDPSAYERAQYLRTLRTVKPG